MCLICCGLFIVRLASIRVHAIGVSVGSVWGYLLACHIGGRVGPSYCKLVDLVIAWEAGLVRRGSMRFATQTVSDSMKYLVFGYRVRSTKTSITMVN